MPRRTVSRWVCLDVKTPSGTQNQIFTFFFIVRQLPVCWCGTPSLTRWRIYCLQLLMALARVVILESESSGTHDQILLPQIRDSQTWTTGSPYLYPSRSRVTQLYPQTLGSLFVVSYDSHLHIGWLLRSGGPDIAEAGTWFNCRGNVFTDRCLAGDAFSVSAIPIFSVVSQYFQ
jgi:hypothetical protein